MTETLNIRVERGKVQALYNDGKVSLSWAAWKMGEIRRRHTFGKWYPMMEIIMGWPKEPKGGPNEPL